MKNETPLKYSLSVLLLSSLLGSISEGAVIYREIFSNTTGVNADLSTTGWTSTIGLGVSDGEGRVQDLPNINAVEASSPANLINGYVFGSSSTNGLLYTDEYAISQAAVSGLTSISWYQGHASDTIGSRVVVLIDSSWYASDQKFTNTAVASGANFATQSSLQSFTWTTAASAWRAVTVDGTTVTLAGSTLGSDLPTGDVSSFGLFLEGSGSFQRRVDTFQIEAVPEPAATLLSGLGVLLLLRRKC